MEKRNAPMIYDGMSAGNKKVYLPERKRFQACILYKKSHDLHIESTSQSSVFSPHIQCSVSASSLH